MTGEVLERETDTRAAVPTVSVIMPAYNAAKTIEQSIESVIAQTFTNWELLVIDDCSNDGTVQIVESLAGRSDRIHLYINERNEGVSQARNRGVIYARGEWIAFLDSDDYWDERKLEKQLRFGREMDAKITYTGTSYMNDAGQISEYILHAEPELSHSTLLKKNIMSCSSVMVRRDIMTQVLFADGELSEDYAAWMRILNEVGRAYGLDEPLLIYRQSGRSKSASRVLSGRMTYNAYREVGYGKVSALLLTLNYSRHSVSKRILICLGRLFNAVSF